MSDVKVKPYTDKELLNRMKSVDGFKAFPKGYFLCGVQSNEDTFNKFDDKMYLFHNDGSNIKFIMVTSCTTNAGISGIYNYNKYNRKGVAVIKTNQWYYGLWSFGYHRGKMPALKQVGKIMLFRDNNKNKKIEEIGKKYTGYFGINFHTAIYGNRVGFFRRLIGGWSVGCQVLNKYNDYIKILNLVRFQNRISYVLLKEF